MESAEAQTAEEAAKVQYLRYYADYCYFSINNLRDSIGPLLFNDL